MKYIQNELIKEQRAEITKKFFVIAKRWTLASKSKGFVTFRALCEDIENNQKFKLPWTIVDVQESARCFCEWFNINSSDLDL